MLWNSSLQCHVSIFHTTFHTVCLWAMEKLLFNPEQWRLSSGQLDVKLLQSRPLSVISLFISHVFLTAGLGSWSGTADGSRLAVGSINADNEGVLTLWRSLLCRRLDDYASIGSYEQVVSDQLHYYHVGYKEGKSNCLWLTNNLTQFVLAAAEVASFRHAVLTYIEPNRLTDA